MRFPTKVTDNTRARVRKYIKEVSNGKETFRVDPNTGARYLGIKREEFLEAIVDILKSGESVVIVSQQGLVVTLTPAFGWEPTNPVPACLENLPQGVPVG